MSAGARVWRWGRWLVSAGIFIYLLVDVDPSQLVQRIGDVRLVPFGFALLLYLAGQLLSAYKWALLGRSVGFERSFLDYTRLYFIGMFFNLFTPSTIGGDLARGLYLADGQRPMLALNSVIFDRVSGLALLMALGAVALLVFPQYGLPRPLTAGLIGGGIALLVGWWVCPRVVRFLPPTNRLRRQVEDDLGAFWRDRRLLLGVSAVSIAFHLAQVCVQWVLVRAAGASVPFSYCLIFHPVISVMTALPVGIGGFGVREGGYIYFLTRIDIDGPIALTTSLLWFGATVVGGVIGAVVFLLSGAELPRLRAQVAAAKSASAA